MSTVFYYCNWYFKGELSPKNKCGLYDRASPEKFFDVSLAYV